MFWFSLNQSKSVILHGFPEDYFDYAVYYLLERDSTDSALYFFCEALMALVFWISSDYWEADGVVDINRCTFVVPDYHGCVDIFDKVY